MGWSEMFEEWWVEHGEILEVGDQVAVVERFGGTGMKGSDADVALSNRWLGWSPSKTERSGGSRSTRLSKSPRSRRAVGVADAA